MKLTDWFKPPLVPVRSGWFEACIFDAGWIYEWRVYWDMDRKAWLDKEGGNSLIDQNQTWRGQTK
jgi:hypothetical protein